MKVEEDLLSPLLYTSFINPIKRFRGLQHGEWLGIIEVCHFLRVHFKSCWCRSVYFKTCLLIGQILMTSFCAKFKSWSISPHSTTCSYIDAVYIITSVVLINIMYILKVKRLVKTFLEIFCVLYRYIIKCNKYVKNKVIPKFKR